MTYDLIKHRFPDAPCVVGARVVESATGREGRIAPPVPGLGDRLRVRFAGEVLARPVHPGSLAYRDVPSPVRLHPEDTCRDLDDAFVGPNGPVISQDLCG